MKGKIRFKYLFVDIGGVLLSDGWVHAFRKLAAKKFDLDPEEFEKRHNEAFDTYELGKLNIEEYLNRVVDDEKWNICFLIVDTRNWLPGRKVLIMPRWINHIDCDELKVYINLSKESIQNSPVFDSSKPVGKDYEIELFKHYGDKEIHLNKTGGV